MIWDMCSPVTPIVKPLEARFAEVPDMSEGLIVGANDCITMGFVPHMHHLEFRDLARQVNDTSLRAPMDGIMNLLLESSQLKSLASASSPALGAG